MSEQFWPLHISARHLLQNLGTEMYTPEESLYELLRNGMVACMGDDEWDVSKCHIEIDLVNNHPLAPKCLSLVLLDHGSGFTEQRIQTFCWVGPSSEDHSNNSRGHKGAAQKRVGRFAGYAENEVCISGNLDEAVKSGFYILTRTTHSGPVRFVSMVPLEIEKNQGVRVQLLDPNATELGSVRGIKGSFTAIVIPNSVFKKPDEIRKALQWRIPRKPDQTFDLRIAGRRLEPPPLATRINNIQENGQIEVYLDATKEGEEGGVWFTDADTGLRVVSGRQLYTHVVYPFWHPGITGDIFAPNVLANQNTSRTSLSTKYLKGKVWASVNAYLMGQVAKKAEGLLGKKEVFGTDQVSQVILELAAMCNKVYGEPTITFGPPYPGPRGPRPPSPNPPNGTRVKHTPPSEPRERKTNRIVNLRIGEDEFVLTPRPLQPFIFAEVDSINGKTLYINERNYKGLPGNKEGSGRKAEHIVLMVLDAIARSKYGDDPTRCTEYVAQTRHELFSS